jgi:ArsR family transcriptional regulator, arsenate/arsenite/antimonite-responsive transcriptional repressor
LDGPMNRSEIEKISKALADETRLRIFEAISATQHTNCGEIVSMRGVTPATVSHHLKILSEAGLIACRREGQFVYSRAVPETIAAYTRALLKIGCGKKTTRRRWLANQSVGFLEKPKNGSCPLPYKFSLFGPSARALTPEWSAIRKLAINGFWEVNRTTSF